MNQMPKILCEIYHEVQCEPIPASNLTEFMTDWHHYTARAHENIPDLSIKDDGETIVLGTISPGCQACKDGIWDCIFLTMQCNLSCPFCYSPRASLEDMPGSAFGSSRDQIAMGYAQARIRGVSFTGGEPFRNPAQLLDWVAWARELLPNGYLWVYTNGTMVQKQTLKDLARLGLDEIRFNAAATDYVNPLTIETMSLAGEWIPTVTVEIPAIPKDAKKLLSSLSTWVKAGVRHLNIHELLYEPGTPSDQMSGERAKVWLPDGHVTAVDPGSRDLILSVIAFVVHEGLKLPVNVCSFANKLRQVRGRRRSLLPLTQAKFERLICNNLLESYLLYSDQEQYIYCHPDQLKEMLSSHPGWKAARIARTAPLSIQDRGRWVMCEFLFSAGPEPMKRTA